jgi:hypothetical protein
VDITDDMVDEVFNRAILIPPGTRVRRIRDTIRLLLKVVASARDRGLPRRTMEAELAYCRFRIARLPIPELRSETERESAEFHRVLGASIEAIYSRSDQPGAG